MKSKKKSKLSTIILVLIMVAGVALLLYPTISDYWNSLHQSRAIATYVRTVEEMDTVDKEGLWAEAVQYNKELAESGYKFNLSDKELQVYEQMLSTEDTDVMAFVEIPKIRCNLPIYHGTDEAVLQVGIGHLEWSSLPVGGKSTHCVISGHRGLPSAKLFTDIDQLQEGDIFMIRTLDKTLTYEVDQIRTVLPEELQELEIEKGQDYCTLMTCTPYGVNTHRMLVRGTRIENLSASVMTEATRIDPMVVASILTVVILTIILIWLIVGLMRNRNKPRR